ncbi:MAG: lipocalin-like domain-containing protein [Chloroflexi bacterium]|nr:lipocalin-like domain-containing protein [Chloroflexota bacterium]
MHQLVGTWRLVSQHTHYPDGTTIATRGENPDGILIYDEFGNMAVQLMRTDAQLVHYTDLNSRDTAMSGYHAYYGTYEIDEKASVVRHHVVGAAFPDYRSTTQVRHFKLEDDILTLQARSTVEDNFRVLVWQRVTR